MLDPPFRVSVILPRGVSFTCSRYPAATLYGDTSNLRISELAVVQRDGSTKAPRWYYALGDVTAIKPARRQQTDELGLSYRNEMMH
jgi:hypothetical protein